MKFVGVFSSAFLALTIFGSTEVSARVGGTTTSGSIRSLQTALNVTEEVRAAVEPILNPPSLSLVTDDDDGETLLGLCAGDCDDDDDCEGTLVCFQRDEGDVVPGCSPGAIGFEDNDRDFCVFPPVDFLGVGPEEFGRDNLPLELCQGDCDTDRQCGQGLICFQRGRFDPAPGCSGTEEFTAETNRPSDFCVPEIYANSYELLGITPPPTNAPTTPPPTPDNMVQQVGNNGLPFVGQPLDVFPLGLCQADCDFDEECAVGLICFQRIDSAAPIPDDCVGTAVADEDYCIPDPAYIPPPTLPPCDVGVNTTVIVNGTSQVIFVNGTTFNCTLPDMDVDLMSDGPVDDMGLTININRNGDD